MLLLQLLRPSARRSHRAPRRPVPRQPRLSFECLETRNLLAAPFGLSAVPLAAHLDRGDGGGSVLRGDDHAGAPTATPINVAAFDGDEHAAIYMPPSDEVRVIVLVEMPLPMLVRVLDGWLHEMDRSALDRVPVVPTVTAPLASLDHSTPVATESTTTAPIHVGTATGEVPPTGNITAPLNIAQVVPGTPNAPLPPLPPLPLPALDPSALAAHVLANIEPLRAKVQEFFAVGVPGPTQVSVTGSAYAPVASPSSIAVPAAVPWLAGLLTPVVHIDALEPLLAIEQVVGAAQGWGRALASKVAALIASPWLAGAAVAVAAVALCRRRARRVPHAEDDTLEVPTITGPSQLT